MILFKDSASLSRYLDSFRRDDRKIGFVPTMGALHVGHIALLEQAKTEVDLTVCSIFINPTQFNDRNDYEKYPVTLEEDIKKIESAGAVVLFLPDADKLYPAGTDNLEQYRVGYLETVLEGKYRPGHFQGVCQVMYRLLSIIKPQKLFMGQKDYQQSLVVEQLLETMNIGTSMIVCPTYRESNGLAMSSRNMRLTETERRDAGKIYEALQYIKNNLRPGELGSLKNDATSLLVKAGFKIDYVETADASNLQLTDTWDGKQKLVALVAVFIRDVRLIDNIVI